MLFSDKYVSSYFPHKNLANYVYLGDIPKVSGFIRINFLFFTFPYQIYPNILPNLI